MVLVAPGEPHSFVSCGEDGTVRFYDLRAKSKCTCSGCTEDVLVDTQHAITSISINPKLPYQLAVGCKDSRVRIFDRRMLGTGLKTRSVVRHGKRMRGLISEFCPKDLKDRQSCRVTSVQYSDNGEDVLVSYSTDYLYLFSTSTRETKSYDTTCSMKSNSDVYESSAEQDDVPPMKRLRLRGDWSDTGPQARPEAEEEGAESDLMKRMSELFSTWLEDAVRAGSNHSVASTHSEQASDAEVDTQQVEVDTQQVEVDTQDEMSENSIESRESQSLEDARSNAACGSCDQTGSESCDETVKDGIVREECNAHVDNADTELSHSDERTICQASSSSDTNNECSNMSTHQTSVPGPLSQAAFCHGSVANCNHTASMATSASCTEDVAACVSESNVNPACKSDTVFLEHDLNFLCMEQSSSHAHTQPVETGSCSARELAHIGRCACEDRDETLPSASTGVDDYLDNTEISSTELAQPVRIEETVQTSNSNQVNATSDSGPARVRLSRGINFLDRNIAASRIQKFLRAKKAAMLQADDDDEAQLPVTYPLVSHVYKGHRNARTMIKEANFWGDKYVMSGSDCGRIFIWEKDTEEVVALLQGDRHVVNCIQPHPYDPILATSGIDHDVKIWAPLAASPASLDGVDDIVRWNEMMLDESRDTITVPASFVLRMLASFGNLRRRRRQEDDVDGSDSDDES